MRSTAIAAALLSTGLAAPLLYLELRNGYSNFPYPLFAVLWLVPAAFVFAAAPLARTIRAGESLLANPVVLGARVGFLLLAAFFWTAVVNDQLPCFFGAPNCD
jgi:hypothetical protein